MPDRDLELLRAFRADEAEPPAGLQARIEEQLWQSILAEEAASARGAAVSGGAVPGPRTRRRFGRWSEGWLRPAVAVGAAACIAVVVAVTSDGGSGVTTTTTTGASGVRQASAGVLDGAASALFGGSASASAASASQPIAGKFDLTEVDDSDRALAAGPVRDEATGELNEETRNLVRGASRDPEQLLASLRAASAELVGSDPGDRVSFHLAMQWVDAGDVPTDLRAAMLRSLEGMNGLDQAARAVDVLGRPGLVIGHLDGATGMRDQYVLDASDGTLLERRSYTTGYVDPACPPGTFTDHVVLDDDGHVVDPAEAPFIDWPQVIASCDPSR